MLKRWSCVCLRSACAVKCACRAAGYWRPVFGGPREKPSDFFLDETRVLCGSARLGVWPVNAGLLWRCGRVTSPRDLTRAVGCGSPGWFQTFRKGCDGERNGTIYHWHIKSYLTSPYCNLNITRVSSACYILRPPFLPRGGVSPVRDESSGE